MNTKLWLHAFLPKSRSNGPGVRAVIWTQGCSLGCLGCFNPETHPSQVGERVTVQELFHRIMALGTSIQGLTISGGEPLQQHRPLLALLQRVRAETPLSILLFSGYTWEEIQRMPGRDELLASLDVLIAGRYDSAQRVASGLLGSADKTIHLLSDRYTFDDLQSVPETELIVNSKGEVMISGIDPIAW